MYCPKCGTFNDNENIWCINCGHGKLPTAFVRAQAVQQPETMLKPQNGVQTAADGVDSFAAEGEPFVNEEKDIILPTEYKKNTDEAEGVPVSDGHVQPVRPGYKWEIKKKEIKDYFIWAILSAVFCSITFGVAAIIFSAMTKAEKASGDLARAEIYSSKVKLFSIIALIVGVIKYVFAFLLVSVIASGILLPFYPYYF